MSKRTLEHSSQNTDNTDNEDNDSPKHRKPNPTGEGEGEGEGLAMTTEYIDSQSSQDSTGTDPETTPRRKVTVKGKKPLEIGSVMTTEDSSIGPELPSLKVPEVSQETNMKENGEDIPVYTPYPSLLSRSDIQDYETLIHKDKLEGGEKLRLTHFLTMYRTKFKYKQFQPMVSITLPDKTTGIPAEVPHLLPPKFEIPIYCLTSFYNLLDIILNNFIALISNKIEPKPSSFILLPSTKYTVSKISYFPNTDIAECGASFNLIIVSFQKTRFASTSDINNIDIYYNYIDKDTCDVINTPPKCMALIYVGNKLNTLEYDNSNQSIPFNYTMYGHPLTTSVSLFPGGFGYDLFPIYKQIWLNFKPISSSFFKSTPRTPRHETPRHGVLEVEPQLQLQTVNDTFTVDNLNSILAFNTENQSEIFMIYTRLLQDKLPSYDVHNDIVVPIMTMKYQSKPPQEPPEIIEYKSNLGTKLEILQSKNESIHASILRLSGIGNFNQDFLNAKFLCGLLLDSIDMTHDFKLCTNFLINILNTYTSTSTSTSVNLTVAIADLRKLIVTMCTGGNPPTIDVDKSHTYCDDVFNRYLSELQGLGIIVPPLPTEMKNIDRNSLVLTTLLQSNCGITLTEANKEVYFESGKKEIYDLGGEPREITPLSSLDGAPGFQNNPTRSVKYICFLGGLILAIISIGTNVGGETNTYISLKFNIYTWIDRGSNDWVLNTPTTNQPFAEQETKILTVSLPYNNKSSITLNDILQLLPVAFVKAERGSGSCKPPIFTVMDKGVVITGISSFTINNSISPTNIDLNKDDMHCLLLMSLKTVCDKFCTPELLRTDSPPKIISTSDSYVWMWLFYSYISGSIPFFPMICRNQATEQWTIIPPIMNNTKEFIESLINMEILCEETIFPKWNNLNEAVLSYLDAKGNDIFSNIYYELLSYQLIRDEQPIFTEKCKGLMEEARALLNEINGTDARNTDIEIKTLVEHIMMLKKAFNQTFDCFEKCSENQSELFIFKKLHIISEDNTLVPYNNNFYLLRSPSNSSKILVVSKKCSDHFKSLLKDEDVSENISSITFTYDKQQPNELLLSRSIEELADIQVAAAVVASAAASASASATAASSAAALKATFKASGLSKKEDAEKKKAFDAELNTKIMGLGYYEYQIPSIKTTVMKLIRDDPTLTIDEVLTRLQTQPRAIRTDKSVQVQVRQPTQETYTLFEGQFPIEFLIQIASRKVYDVIHKFKIGKQHSEPNSDVCVDMGNKLNNDMVFYTDEVLKDVSVKIFFFKHNYSHNVSDVSDILEIFKIELMLILSVFQLIFIDSFDSQTEDNGVDTQLFIDYKDFVSAICCINKSNIKGRIESFLNPIFDFLKKKEMAPPHTELNFLLHIQDFVDKMDLERNEEDVSEMGSGEKEEAFETEPELKNLVGTVSETRSGEDEFETVTEEDEESETRIGEEDEGSLKQGGIVLEPEQNDNFPSIADSILMTNLSSLISHIDNASREIGVFDTKILHIVPENLKQFINDQSGKIKEMLLTINKEGLDILLLQHPKILESIFELYNEGLITNKILEIILDELDKHQDDIYRIINEDYHENSKQFFIDTFGLQSCNFRLVSDSYLGSSENVEMIEDHTDTVLGSNTTSHNEEDKLGIFISQLPKSTQQNISSFIDDDPEKMRYINNLQALYNSLKADKQQELYEFIFNLPLVTQQNIFELQNDEEKLTYLSLLKKLSDEVQPQQDHLNELYRQSQQSQNSSSSSSSSSHQPYNITTDFIYKLPLTTLINISKYSNGIEYLIQLMSVLRLFQNHPVLQNIILNLSQDEQHRFLYNDPKERDSILNPIYGRLDFNSSVESFIALLPPNVQDNIIFIPGIPNTIEYINNLYKLVNTTNDSHLRDFILSLPLNNQLFLFKYITDHPTEINDIVNKLRTQHQYRGGNKKSKNKQSKNKRNISKHKHTKNKNKQNKNKQNKTKKHNRTKIHRITKKSRFL